MIVGGEVVKTKTTILSRSFRQYVVGKDEKGDGNKAEHTGE